MGAEPENPPEEAPEKPEAAALDEVLSKDRVPVVRPDGSLASVRSANYERALAQGYRFQRPDEQEKFHTQLKYGDSPFRAALSGAARGATLGLSDIAGPALGITSKKTLEGLKEANPGASIAGDVAGTAASLLIPGAEDVSGPGLVSKLGHLVEHGVAQEGAGLLGRIGAKALAGGVEGLTYGAMNAVSESYLGDTDLNAQKLIASAGLGGALGVGAAGISGLLGEGVSALKPIIKEQAESLADRYTLKAAGGIQSDINKLSLEERPAIARMLRDRGHIQNGGSPAGVFKSVESDLNQQSQKVGKELGLEMVENGHLSPLTPAESTAEVTGPALKAQGEVIGGVLRDADASGAHFNFSKPSVRIREFRKTLNAAEERISGKSIDNVLADLEAEYEKAGNKAGFEAANDLKSTHYEDINWLGESKAKNNVMKQVAGILNDEIETQLKPVAGEEFFQQFMKAKKSYGLAVEADKLANKGWSGKDIIDRLLEKAGPAGAAGEEAGLYGQLSKAYDIGLKGFNRMQGNRGASLSDYIAGNALGSIAGGPLGLLSGAAGMVGNKLLRERGPAVIANLASKIAESPVLSTVAEHFAGSLASKREALGAFAPELESAAAHSPEQALATHIELAKTHPDYKDAAALAGMAFESGHREAAVALEKAHALHGVKKLLQGHDEEVGRLVEKALHKGGDVAAEHHAADALKKQAFGSKRQRKVDPAEAHETHIREVTRLAASPQALIDRTAAHTGQLGSHAPAITAAVTGTASRAVNFLASKGAKPMGGPLAPDWHPSPQEIAKFNRYYAAVQNPTAILHQAAAGTLTPEAVEAVKTVYPQLYLSMQQAVADRLAEKPKGVPYSQRVQLGLLTGIDADGTMSPAAIQRSQAVYHGPSAKGPEDQAGGSGASKSGASKLTLAKRSMTPMAASAARGE